MIGFVELLRSDTRNFIWSPHVQAEFFGAIRKFWPLLNDESRQEVCNMILEGPPRELRFPDDSESKWTHFVNRRIWERLTRIEKVAPGLSEPAAERLREIQHEHPEWRLQNSDRENVAFIGEPYMGASPKAHRIADEWLVLPIPEIAERIRNELYQGERNIYPGYFPGQVWDAIIEKDQGKVLKILRCFLEQEFYHEEIWSKGLLAFSSISKRDENAQELLNLIGDFSGDFMGKHEIIYAVTAILNSMAKSLGEDEIESNVEVFLDFWDRLFPYAIKEARSGMYEDSLGIITYAINHPAGRITEMLFYLFPAGDSPRGSGIHPDMKTRLEKILQSYDTGAHGWRAGYVTIVTQLLCFHFLDPKWTEKMIVPAFDWGNEDKAKVAWSGYLSRPCIDPDLWEVIKGDFILAFERHDGLPYKSYRLFAYVAIWWPGTLSHEDARHCVKEMGHHGRREVLNCFYLALNRDEVQPSVMWKEQIEPWIKEVWPPDVNFRSPEEAYLFAELAISTGSSFPDAVNTLCGFLSHLEGTDACRILRQIESNADSERTALNSDSETLLKFLNKIFPETIQYFRRDVKEFLNRMKEADPAIENNPHYRRLSELTL